LEDKDGDGSLVEACGISGSHGGKQVWSTSWGMLVCCEGKCIWKWLKITSNNEWALALVLSIQVLLPQNMLEYFSPAKNLRVHHFLSMVHDAQGDPCTTTIFRCIVCLQLLYSANSPIPLTKYSILHNGISS
jgi:hypothetical protein